MGKPLVTIEYKTANGSRICVEASTLVKELLEKSDRTSRSQRRQDRKHLEFTSLTDEFLVLSLLAALGIPPTFIKKWSAMHDCMRLSASSEFEYSNSASPLLAHKNGLGKCLYGANPQTHFKQILQAEKKNAVLIICRL